MFFINVLFVCFYKKFFIPLLYNLLNGIYFRFQNDTVRFKTPQTRRTDSVVSAVGRFSSVRKSKLGILGRT